MKQFGESTAKKLTLDSVPVESIYNFEGENYKEKQKVNISVLFLNFKKIIFKFRNHRMNIAEVSLLSEPLMFLSPRLKTSDCLLRHLPGK